MSLLRPLLRKHTRLLLSLLKRVDGVTPKISFISTSLVLLMFIMILSQLIVVSAEKPPVIHQYDSFKLPQTIITQPGVRFSYARIIPVSSSPNVDLCKLSNVFNTYPTLKSAHKKNATLALEMDQLLFRVEEDPMNSCLSFFCGGSSDLNHNYSSSFLSVNLGPLGYCLGNEVYNYDHRDHYSSNIVASMYNFCSLCRMNSNSNLTLSGMREQLSNCSLYSHLSEKANGKHCPGNRSIMHSNQYGFTQDKHVEMFACLCEDNNRISFAFDCGAYSRGWMPIATFVFPPIFLVLYILIFVFQIVYLIIPSFVAFRAEQKDVFETTIWGKFGKIVSLRNQGMFMVFIGSVSCIIAQIMAIVYALTAADDYAMFRVLGGVLGSLSYAIILIHWAHMTRLVLSRKQLTEEEQRVSWFHVIFASSVYIVAVAMVIALVICVALGNQYVGYLIVCVVMFLFIVIFPMGFTVFGLIMYFKLRLSLNEVSGRKGLLQFKFTRFMLVVNVVYSAVLICLIVYGLTFAISWDGLSTFIGIFRTVICDAAILATLVLMSLMLSDKEMTVEVYGQRIGELITLSCFNQLKQSNTQKEPYTPRGAVESDHIASVPSESAVETPSVTKETHQTENTKQRV